jgi:hypothetical protein
MCGLLGGHETEGLRETTVSQDRGVEHIYQLSTS